MNPYRPTQNISSKYFFFVNSHIFANSNTNLAVTHWKLFHLTFSFLYFRFSLIFVDIHINLPININTEIDVNRCFYTKTRQNGGPAKHLIMTAILWQLAGNSKDNILWKSQNFPLWYTGCLIQKFSIVKHPVSLLLEHQTTKKLCFSDKYSETDKKLTPKKNIQIVMLLELLPKKIWPFCRKPNKLMMSPYFEWSLRETRSSV